MPKFKENQQVKLVPCGPVTITAVSADDNGNDLYTVEWSDKAGLSTEAFVSEDDLQDDPTAQESTDAGASGADVDGDAATKEVEAANAAAAKSDAPDDNGSAGD